MQATELRMMDLALPSNHHFFISAKILPHLPSSLRWIYRQVFGNLQRLDTVIDILIICFFLLLFSLINCFGK